ncbi:hypothetical protein MP638_003102 [Amoeboaphelidium occidentale]|nr:hypothetical protein MP638_003102 [Amoeboaphelidium occidentale]
MCLMMDSESCSDNRLFISVMPLRHKQTQAPPPFYAGSKTPTTVSRVLPSPAKSSPTKKSPTSRGRHCHCQCDSNSPYNDNDYHHGNSEARSYSSSPRCKPEAYTVGLKQVHHSTNGRSTTFGTETWFDVPHMEHSGYYSDVTEYEINQGSSTNGKRNASPVRRQSPGRKSELFKTSSEASSHSPSHVGHDKQNNDTRPRVYIHHHYHHHIHEPYVDAEMNEHLTQDRVNDTVKVSSAKTERRSVSFKTSSHKNDHVANPNERKLDEIMAHIKRMKLKHCAIKSTTIDRTGKNFISPSSNKDTAKSRQKS